MEGRVRLEVLGRMEGRTQHSGVGEMEERGQVLQMESRKAMEQIHPGALWGMLACSPKASCDIMEIDGATFQKKLKHILVSTFYCTQTLLEMR
ncbi:unnamed protein product [Leuciscus chuanchicus]